MKKLGRHIVLALALAVLLSGAAWAINVTPVLKSGDYEYILTDAGDAIIMRYKGNDKNVVIPESLDGHTVKELGLLFDDLIDHMAEHPDAMVFKNCTFLESVTIPNTVTDINYGVFWGCTSLKTIIVPESVEFIESMAFYKCNALDNLVLPDKFIDIRDNAFEETAYMNNEKYWENGFLYVGHHLIKVKNDLTGNQVIKDGTVNIAKDAFTVYSNIEGITIPGSISRIEYTAFAGLEKLKTVVIKDGVQVIGAHAFTQCPSLKNVTIPNSVTSIEYAAFRWCTSLEKIEIPDSVTYFGEYVLYETAYYYNEDNWEGDVLYINDILLHARWYIDGKYEVKDGTKWIAGWAFRDCTHLSSIVIPNSVKNIGSLAFYNCSSLMDVYFYGTRAQWDEIEIGTEYAPHSTVEYNGNDALLSANLCILDSKPANRGKYKIDDAVNILRYIAGWNIEIDTGRADVDKDGEISSADVVLILRYLAGWNVKI